MYSNIEIRDFEFEGETNWYWIKGDEACFYSGIEHWKDYHSKIYFKYIKNYGTVVTAGTNCGMYARLYAKRFKRVYAFEPEPVAFNCMVNNTPYDHVVKINCALGPGHGIVGINRVPQEGPGSNELNIGMNNIAAPSERFEIPMITIDSLMLNACDLIALDVEGYEMGVLQGAKNTIKKYRPVIIAERFNGRENQEFMKNMGYDYVDQSFLDSIYVAPDTPKLFSYSTTNA